MGRQSPILHYFNHSFFKKWANPGIFFIYFRPFKHTFQFLKNGPNPASFCLFSFFSQYNDKYSANLTKNEIKAQMVCLGFEPGGGRMVGADGSTELWRYPITHYISHYNFYNKCVKSPSSRQCRDSNSQRLELSILPQPLHHGFLQSNFKRIKIVNFIEI